MTEAQVMEAYETFLMALSFEGVTLSRGRQLWDLAFTAGKLWRGQEFISSLRMSCGTAEKEEDGKAAG